MHTLSTLRFPRMDFGWTSVNLGDHRPTSNVLPATYVEDLADPALLHRCQRSAHCHFVESSSIDNSHCPTPTHLGGDGSASDVWYCSECGDGPIPNWNPVCVSCDSKKSNASWSGALQHQHGDSQEQPQDGPKPEVKWFCGSCGDGPMGDWNPVCSECGHQRDGCCTTETI